MGKGSSIVVQKPEATDEPVHMAGADDTTEDEAPTDTADLTEDEPPADAADVATGPTTAEETAPADTTDADELAAVEMPEAVDQGSLAVETLDYNEEGDLTLKGKAEPETDLNVYIDDEHVGTVESDETGEWEVTPEDEVEPGSYTLRVDQIDPAGVVLARIETPLVRARPELLMLGDAIVVVQPGNSLWRIARRNHGRRHPLHRDLRGQPQPDQGSGAHLSGPDLHRSGARIRPGTPPAPVTPSRATT